MNSASISTSPLRTAPVISVPEKNGTTANIASSRGSVIATGANQALEGGELDGVHG